MERDDPSGASGAGDPGKWTALLRELAAPPRPGAAPPPLLPAGTVVGRFEIVGALGRGAFGAVYEARDRVLGRPVALKFVLPGTARTGEDQLAREAEAIARLSHPNLLAIHDLGTGEHGPYLVLELLRGQTLQAQLAGGPLPVPEALRVAREVARGLAHAHGQGVVHRDLKPSNVFLAADGQVKLLDFGMAHAFGRRRVSGGTPAYMAPEQWLDAPEDERTDVFALGVLLFRMLSGAHPFPDDGGRWVQGRTPAPRLVIPGAAPLEALVARMLEREPTARPRDGAEVLSALEAIAPAVPEAPPTGGSGVRTRPGGSALGRVAARFPGGGRTLLLALGLAAAAGIAAALGAGWGPGAKADLAAIPQASIAVLPFADLSPEHDQEYFSDGVTEEILAALWKLPGIRVPGRASSFWFKGKDADPAEIARRLGVAHLLEGSVRRSGTRLRINASVVRAADGQRLWSRSFEREDGDVFAVQEEIARAVVGALEVRLLPGQGALIPDRRPSDPEVHRLYLLGRHLYDRQTPADEEAAVQALEQAVRIDPDYLPARTWLILARALLAELGPTDLSRLGEPTYDTARAEAQALREIDAVIAHAPDYAEAYQVRGIFRCSGAMDWEGARGDYERALSLAPGNGAARLEYASLLATLGRLPEALAIAQRLVETDPLDPSVYRYLGDFQAASGQPGQAEATYRRGLEIAPDHAYLLRERGYALLLLGRPAEALRLFEHHPVFWMRDVGLALAHHRLRDDPASRAALDRLVALAAGASLAVDYQIAEAHAWRGEADEAFAWLEKAFARRDTGLRYVGYDPLLHRIRGDPRYADLLRRMRLPVVR